MALFLEHNDGMKKPSGIFAALENGNRIGKRKYEKQVAALRVELLNLQYDLREADFSVVVLLAGNDRPEVVSMLRTLHDWLDERYLHHFVMFGADQMQDPERPIAKRYWKRLPPKGRIGVFLGGWPTFLLRSALAADWTQDQLDEALHTVNRFEQQQSDNGALVLKYWLHLPESVLNKRVAAADDDPETHWDIAQYDWEFLQHTPSETALVEHIIQHTDQSWAPWTLVESADARFRNLTVGQHVARVVGERLRKAPKPTKVPATKDLQAATEQLSLDDLDLSARVDPADYERELAALQARINRLAHRAREAGIATVLVFEGVDAAGKGGVIRRLARALPVQHTRVIRISAPNEAEQARHYMWRFWTRLPRHGETVIFDRSWYGRVLVERVEEIAPEHEWRRAYEEINDFEESLCRSGFVFKKFWLQIDADEQLKRFEARARTPYKKYKLTAEDFRNREKWDEYQAAVRDMIAATGTDIAPWHLIAANDKRHARLEVLREVAQGLEVQLDAVTALEGPDD